MPEGVTQSEEYLGKLCRRTFLRFWSFQNLFKQPGKELCDLLVVFGSDVLIFSDKHCAFRLDLDPRLAWQRWYKHGVLDSAKQLVGAERWMKEQRSRIFLDSKCVESIPLPLPANPRFHRIVTCRGVADASRQAWGGRGSLFVMNDSLEGCARTPFRLGAFDGHHRMFHILDEVALDAVLATEDTVSDFCAYLRRKEALFANGRTVVAASEEDLLGLYLSGPAHAGEGHDFDVPADANIVIVEEGHWNGWLASEQRAARSAADAISYCWDKLIEKFAFHITTDTQHFSSGGGIPAQEISIRWMARESRVRRRMIAETLLDAMAKTRTGQMRRRYLMPSHAGEPFWVFLVLPRPADHE
jgi:hypothetical protein